MRGADGKPVSRGTVAGAGQEGVKARLCDWAELAASRVTGCRLSWATALQERTEE